MAKELDLCLQIQGGEGKEINKEETVIKEQVPKPGIMAEGGGTIYVEI